MKNSNQYLSLFHLFKETHLSFGERCAKELCTEITTSFWQKFLKFHKKLFYKKFLVSGFGADAPTDNALKKRGFSAFFILSSTFGTAVPSLRFKGLFEKAP